MAATDVVTHTWRTFVEEEERHVSTPPSNARHRASTAQTTSHASDVDMHDATPTAPLQEQKAPVRERLGVEDAVRVFMERDAVNAFIASAVEYWKGSDAFDSLDSVDAFTYALFEGLLSGKSGFSIDLICKKVLLFGRAELALPYNVFSVAQLNVFIDLDDAADILEAPSLHRTKRMTPAAAAIPLENLPPVLVNDDCVWKKHVLPGRSRADRRKRTAATEISTPAAANKSAVILENKLRRIRVLCVEARHVVTVHQYLRRGQLLAEYVFQELFGDDASPTQQHVSSAAVMSRARGSGNVSTLATRSYLMQRSFLLQFFEEYHKELYKLAFDAGNEEGAHALIALCKLFEDDVRPETQYEVLNAARILRAVDAGLDSDVDMLMETS